MNVRLTVIGSSPAWPNPGSAQSGYLVESDAEPRRSLLLDCGPGVLGRLRANGGRRVNAAAITHFHLDHWGDLVPWAWLNAYGPTDEHIPCSVWLPPGGRSQLEAFAAHLREPRHVRLRLRPQRVRAGDAVPGGRLRGRGAPPAALHDGGLRLPRAGGRQAARLLRRLRPDRGALGARARSRPLRLRGDPRARPTRTASPAAICRPTKRWPRPTARSSSRTGRSSSRSPRASAWQRTVSWSRSPADRLFDKVERGPHHPMSPCVVTGCWASTVYTNHSRWFVKSWWPK